MAFGEFWCADSLHLAGAGFDEGVRVPGSRVGFRIQDYGFGAHSFGFRAQGSGLKV